ncbi:hypothetical protein ACHAPV_004720 [Trichoderma viride]
MSSLHIDNVSEPSFTSTIRNTTYIELPMDFDFSDIDFENLRTTDDIDRFIALMEQLVEILYQQQRQLIQRLNEIIWDTFYDFPFPDDYYDYDDPGNHGGNGDFYPY